MNYKVGAQRILICLGIALILTVVTMVLYSNVIVVDFITTTYFSMFYFIIFFGIISEIVIMLCK